MIDPATVRTAIRLNNRVRWCLYYDELFEAADLQCTYVRDTDEPLYNSAQALSSADATTIDFIESYYPPNTVPIICIDPAVPESLVPLLHSREYVELPQLREYWYGYRLDADPGEISAPAPGRIEVLRIDPAGPDLAAYVRINQSTGNLPAAVITNLQRNLARRRLRDVELVLQMALLDGRPAAINAVGVCQGMAFLAGSGTLEFARGLGLGFYMLNQGLAAALTAGAAIAFATATANSSLHRYGFDRTWIRSCFRSSRMSAAPHTRRYI
jgi:hypothetical protein